MCGWEGKLFVDLPCNPYPLMDSPRSPLGVVATKKKTSLKVISHDTAPTYGH